MTPLSAFGMAFVLVAMITILVLPRRWAAVPLCVAAAYMTLSQGVEAGPFHFYSIRMVITAGILRVVLRREDMAGGRHGVDTAMLLWSLWAVASSFFHQDPVSALTFRLGLVFNATGIYFLLRVFCPSFADVLRLCRITCILLVPVALEMIYEQLTAYNVFSILGGVDATPQLRGGRLRAQGPFAHAILAGTVGAAFLPIAAGLWRSHRKTAIAGIFACVTMILTCASSGPVMSAILAVGGLLMWPLRRRMRVLRWLAVAGYVLLDLLMNVAPYYLIARIDVAGGSTGWHRAALISAAIEHVDEWWLAGTDVTRHWMPTGTSWSAEHADITNHYIHMGVLGGLLLMLLFIAVLWKGFAGVGRYVTEKSEAAEPERYFVWALGASLFAHAATSLSVSYFDQSFLFLYLTLAAIASVTAKPVPRKLSWRERRRAAGPQPPPVLAGEGGG